MKEKISEHISYKEATSSQTAIRHGLNNDPNPDQLESMKRLAHSLFEPLRTYISMKRGKDTPIHINSFFRGPEVNAQIKGSSTSQHCKGEAIDIETNFSDFTNRDLFYTIIKRASFDQLICEFISDGEPAWIHVSHKRIGNRNQVLIATKQDDKTKYLPYTPEVFKEIYG